MDKGSQSKRDHKRSKRKAKNNDWRPLGTRGYGSPMKNQIDSPPQEKPLNDRQMAFARLIVKGMSSGRAYEAAGYDSSGPSADVGGSRLLRNVKVKAHIDNCLLYTSDAADE